LASVITSQGASTCQYGGMFFYVIFVNRRFQR